jgi:hypothetical protein
LVEFNLEGKDHGKLTIKALSFPVICWSLPTRVNIEDFPHLDGLELADEFEHDRNEAIDVLIGSDYYWQIVIAEMQKGESGPVAVSSKLGWLLSGPLHDSIQLRQPKYSQTWSYPDRARHSTMVPMMKNRT